ncbi:hypothetical protein [Faecalibacterium prausnitzii]|uniref:hypothetical protein n=1 Tax=Faecalibacterium prausnitzii TaxID=853 RepID=UPI0015642FE7|nr:hypothetical protein [Faecalibacterium prausnitzii]
MSYFLCKNSGIHHALCPNPGEFCPKSAVKAAFGKNAGEKSSDDFEKEPLSQSLSGSAALSQKAALQLPLPFTTPPVKMQCRSVRRRSGIAL